MQQLPECKLILDKLRNELPAHLHYHTIDHTLDVFDCASKIAKKEDISPEDLKLLLIAAIYHDSGYLLENKNHEQLSCNIARKYLPQFHYSDHEIETICGIIMATKIPQSPKTHLEEIICDADLDYLGRPDFFTVGDKLYEEFFAIGTIKNKEEWNMMQLAFLQNHHYFTAASKDLRQHQKEENLKTIESKIK